MPLSVSTVRRGGARCRESIRAAGASILHLPPYSADLNPVEQAFTKLTAGLRKAGARTQDALWAIIGRLLHTSSPDECRTQVANPGYEFE